MKYQTHNEPLIDREQVLFHQYFCSDNKSIHLAQAAMARLPRPGVSAARAGRGGAARQGNNPSCPRSTLAWSTASQAQNQDSWRAKIRPMQIAALKTQIVTSSIRSREPQEH